MKAHGYLRFKGDGGLPKQVVVKRRRQQRLEAARHRDDSPPPKRPRMKPAPRVKVRLTDIDTEDLPEDLPEH